MNRHTCLVLIMSLAVAGAGTSVRALTDPTRPYDYMEEPVIIEVEVPEESTEWRLNGIRIHGDNRSAILNGTMIREGETIENARVLTINQTSVVLEEGDKRLVVRLLDTKVKKPAGGDSR